MMHRQIDCPGQPTCTAVHTLTELAETTTSSKRYPDMSRADVRDTLWIELRQAHSHAYYLSRSSTAAQLNRARGYRDGLLEAYAMLTGNMPEAIHEDLQDGLAG